MPKQELAIEPGGAKRLILEWKGMFKNMTVKFDGQLIGEIENQRELREGRTFLLSDGSTLSLKWKNSYPAELQVLRDGQPLPGSSADPEQRVKFATGVLWFMAAGTLIVGVLTAFIPLAFLQDFGFGIGSVIFGVIFGGLAFATGKRVTWALILAIVLFGLDTLVTVIAMIASGQSFVGIVAPRVFLFIPLLQAVPAMRELRDQRETI